MPITETYHRLAAPKQTLDTAVKQLGSGEAWGRCNTIMNGGSGYPSVKAYYGPLPDGADGIEFETSASPDLHSGRQGTTVYWYLEPGGSALPVAGAPDYCCIRITVTKLRYLTARASYMLGGAVWP